MQQKLTDDIKLQLKQQDMYKILKVEPDLLDLIT